MKTFVPLGSKWNDTKKRISVSRIYGSFARVFPNLCILLTKYAPLYQEEFTLGREGGCCRGLFRVIENTDDVFCVKAGDFYLFSHESALLRVK